jgi:hypothetical protein
MRAHATNPPPFSLFAGKILEVQMGLLDMRLVWFISLVYREKTLTIASGLLSFERNRIISL